MAKGRPQRPYSTSWGDLIPGLYKLPDGRWRVIETGFRFTEPDERRAVAKFEALQKPELVNAPGAVGPTTRSSDPTEAALFIKSETPAASFWPWLREQLIANPEYVAKMTGIPELANLRYLPIPKAAIKLEELINVYEKENPSTLRSKRGAVATFKLLIDFAEAKTLTDLTHQKLLAFRAEMEKSTTVKSAGTRALYYARIKTVIGFGLKVGMDESQIRAALDRCKVLWTADSMPVVDPTPISKEDFHKLLDAASDGFWRAWLLLGLNLCMTAEDLCQLRWADFDMEKGTYAAIRVKTRRDRIPRAGTLWPETMEVMKTIKRKSEYVFTSSHGIKFSKNGRVNEFADFREKAGLPSRLKFSSVRDGAYTAAARSTSDERLARVLAGHSAAGYQDHYVLRNPEAVRPACEAVYAVYGPFPRKNSLPDHQAPKN